MPEPIPGAMWIEARIAVEDNSPKNDGPECLSAAYAGGGFSPGRCS